MPRSTVQAPDGRTVTVEHPEGASRDVIVKFAQERLGWAPPREIPIARPGDLVRQFPSPSSYLAGRAKERSGDIAAMVGAAAIPGAGYVPALARAVTAESAKGSMDLAVRGKFEPGMGFASQLLGEGVGRTVSTLLSPKNLAAFAKDSARALADWLKAKVPAFR